MAIILALRQKGKVTAKELADKFEVNIRTIYRDIEALSQMNIPVVAHYGNEGGYSLLGDYFISPIVFNKDEVFSLLLTQKLIDMVNIPGYNQYVNTAFLKIRSFVNDDMETELKELENKIAFDIMYKAPKIQKVEIFDLVKKALEKNFKLSMKYFNPHGLEKTERTICPYGMKFEDGAWYIIAYCDLRMEMRWFRVDRIEEATLTDQTFVIQEGFTINDYCNEGIHSKAQSKKNTQNIKLKMTKELYHIVKDYYRFKFGQIIEEVDHYIINVVSDKPREYISTAFKFYDGMEILEPLWLREEFREEVQKLFKKYK